MFVRHNRDTCIAPQSNSSPKKVLSCFLLANVLPLICLAFASPRGPSNQSIVVSIWKYPWISVMLITLISPKCRYIEIGYDPGFFFVKVSIKRVRLKISKQILLNLDPVPS